MPHRNDISVSPMSHTPNISPSGSATVAGQAPPRPSGLRTELNSEDPSRISPKAPQMTSTPTHTSSNEAPDYLNNGLPHDASSPPQGPYNPNAVTSLNDKLPSSKPSSVRFGPAAPDPVWTSIQNGAPILGNGGSIPGTATPPGRRSVQFARQDSAPTEGMRSPERWDSWNAERAAKKEKMEENKQPDPAPGLIAKLKALASTGSSSLSVGTPGYGHTRSKSAGNIGTGGLYGSGSQSMPHSPMADRFGGVPGTLQEEDSDADAEGSGDEREGGASDGKKKKKKRSRRPHWARGGTETPTTPRQGDGSLQDSPSMAGFRGWMPTPMRRNTLGGDIEDRGGVSEGEGRDRLSAWRRGSAWMTGDRGHSYTGSNDANTPRRPGALRRLTGIAASDNEAGGSSTPRRFFDRSATAGAARRWGVMKHGLKLLGAKKEVHLVDYKKSAELMAELRAGAPAALMLASMIQRDEHGNKRIPVLLEQLKLAVTDTRSEDLKAEEQKEKDDAKGKGKSKKKDKDIDLSEMRKVFFRIELEYGSGVNRMKWVIERTLRDFINLHLRYKLQASTDRYLQLRDLEHRPKQPHFPLKAFPYLRNLKGLGDDSSSEDEAKSTGRPGDETANEGVASEIDGPGRRKWSTRPNFAHRRKSSMLPDGTNPNMTPEERAIAQRQAIKLKIEKQRRQIEEYLQAMIRWLIFRADSNRLCKFLELSALGVRLAAEGSYHGKEGHLVIGGTKGIDFRRILTPGMFFARHSPKWFLVRHSYLVCVDSPENMHIYDVFLLDSKWTTQAKDRKLKDKMKDANALDLAIRAKTKAAYPQHHKLKIVNSERRIDLLAKNERILKQFEESINYMVKNSLWSKPNRFDSFAPVRNGVYAQWLVDGRDYMWNVSRAINMAKDVIYIHDWWLSPQLYMRRPAAISQKWRLDRLLKKKAKEGVKVFIIVYRNVEAAIPIDSEFTKSSMLDLHPNIFVQRSPNQFKKNQFFYAHHEKVCIVDHTVAFVGGIDLCFGRWDTPQHSVTDADRTGFESDFPQHLPKDAEHCQLWPGKDYSNPRVQDFYELDKPYAEMYDRNKIPRMPWHDVSMQVVGQPARDLTRHFVQRWNYVLRGRKPTRPTPFLLPPPDYSSAELEALGLNGTCEVQILRSAANWSLGIQQPEHSIMNAYCKMIEESDHFVYMENQFFITSTETMGVQIINKIGDAIVERAVRAHRNGDNWRCVILIPLMPGFQNTVDAPDGTSVRLIMQCQFRSICRGDSSIFGRLRNEGIDPEEYVSFYSLRAWGQIGPQKMFVTEQLYIHAKVIIVDDRIALIGSANINERSMLGSRDSECAAVVRDTDMLWSTMGGEPYLVGRFAHTLRMRLMREHLGVDVDDVMEEERRAELDREEEEYEARMAGIYDGNVEDIEPLPEPESSGEEGQVRPVASRRASRNRLGKRKAASRSASLAPSEILDLDPNLNEKARPPMHSRPASFNHHVDLDTVPVDSDSSSSASAVTARELKSKLEKEVKITTHNTQHIDVEGLGPDQMKLAEETGAVRGRDSTIINGREVLITDIAPENHGTLERPKSRARPKLSVSPPSDSKDDDKIGNLGLPPILGDRQSSLQAGLTLLSQLPELPLVDDTDIGGPPVIAPPSRSSQSNRFDTTLLLDLKPVPEVGKDCMVDPLNDTFFDDTWNAIAENNTAIFRKVFRCNPDNEVESWGEYTEFQAYAERYMNSQGGKSEAELQQEGKGKSGPPGAGSALPNLGPLGEGITHVMEKVGSQDKEAEGEKPRGDIQSWADAADAQHEKKMSTGEAQGDHISPSQSRDGEFNEKSPVDSNAALSPTLSTTTGIDARLNTAVSQSRSEAGGVTPNGTRTTFADQIPPSASTSTNPLSPSTSTPFSPASNLPAGAQFGSTRQRRNRRGTTKSRRGFSASDDLLSREEAGALLERVQGSLVVFPTEWLRREEEGGNWLYQVDQVAPLGIYD